jgi:hypothetical protein
VTVGDTRRVSGLRLFGLLVAGFVTLIALAVIAGFLYEKLF